MPRPGTTTGRGYDARHQQAVRDLFARHVDGEPCPRALCGHAPMYREPARNCDGAKLEGDHFTRAAALGGGLPDTLSHRRCNRSAGATLGNRLRGARRARARGHGPSTDLDEAWGIGTASRAW